MRVDWSLVFNCKSSWYYWRVDSFHPKSSKLFTVLFSSIVHENVPTRCRYIKRIAFYMFHLLKQCPNSRTFSLKSTVQAYMQYNKKLLLAQITPNWVSNRAHWVSGQSSIFFLNRRTLLNIHILYGSLVKIRFDT